MWVKNKKCEFEIDGEFSYLIDVCSFHFHNKGYICTSVNNQNLHTSSKFGYKIGQIVKLHRILFELHINRKLNHDECIDHKDMVKTNNKIENLRIVNNSENSKNRKLKTDQIYYNICYYKNHNYFVFRHQNKEKKVDRSFRTLHEALAFFLEYDKNNDYVLTKHIHKMKPIEEIENIVLEPEGKCEKCGVSTWSKMTLKQHQKNVHND